MYRRSRLGIGYLSQEPSIFRKLTVEENIMAVLETLDISKEERERRLKKLLAELDITYLAKNKAFTLSGGERRRLEITRAPERPVPARKGGRSGRPLPRMRGIPSRRNFSGNPRRAKAISSLPVFSGGARPRPIRLKAA